MADSNVGLALDGPGKKVATQSLTRGSDTVERQEILLAHPSDETIIIAPATADPADSDPGLPTRPIDHVPGVSATGTIDALDEVVTLAIQGRRQVGIYVASGALTADMQLMVEHSADGGTLWGEDLFWNGDAMVVSDILPHPQKDRRYYSVLTSPSYTHLRVRAAAFNSGSVVVTLTANDQENQTLQSQLLVLQEGPTTVGALNDAVQLAAYGATPAFNVEAGTFAGTLVVEGNPRMQGTTGWSSVLFMANGAFRIGGYALTNPNAAFTIEPLVTQAYARYRVRVSAYTSGNTKIGGRVGPTAATALSLLEKAIPGLTAPPFASQVGGVDPSGLLRALAMRDSYPLGTEQAVIVREARPPIYNFLIPSQVHVASANTVHWDLFNADAALVVRVLSILQIPNITTAVTGVTVDWLLERTTAVGTGGSAQTAWLADLSQAALDADITLRTKPTGGATASTDLRAYTLSSEETNTATLLIASQGGLELVPQPMRPPGGQGIVLRQNQGIRCVQQTSTAEGNTGWLISLTATT